MQAAVADAKFTPMSQQSIPLRGPDKTATPKPALQTTEAVRRKDMAHIIFLNMNHYCAQKSMWLTNLYVSLSRQPLTTASTPFLANQNI